MAKLLQIAAVLIWGICAQAALAGVLYESASLGETGILPSQGHSGEVPGLNVGGGGIRGVRFELTQPSRVTEVGGHFVRSWESPENDKLFGVIVALEGPDDFPDSFNFSADDMLANTTFALPLTSADVYGPMNLSLKPGWYAVVFGSYYDDAFLFGTGGLGALPLTNVDIGDPSYISASLNTPGWSEQSTGFRNMRYVVRGFVIPEPNAASLAVLCCLTSMRSLRRRRAA